MTGSDVTPPGVDDDTGDPEASAATTGLFAGWERSTRQWALVCAALTLAVTLLFAAALVRSGQPRAVTLMLALLPAAGVYAWQTRMVRRRREILRQLFPSEWEAVLQRDVVFFRVLEPAEQQRFRRQIQVFLGEKRISGVGVEIDETTRVLVAASAVIPIFGFLDWEWSEIGEVLVYPSRFDGEFQFGDKHGQNILGMVGTGSLNRLMILSKPDLISGFRNAADKRNVGIHEFAHLVDKTDGVIDGVPGVGLDRQAVGPWLDLVRRKMDEIEAGDSDINRYALTNEAEFFAVTSEYFFERPGVMLRKHPALYAALEQVFNQDLRTRVGALRRELTQKRPKFGRNSPCPCGSGRKFKKCCRGKVSSSRL